MAIDHSASGQALGYMYQFDRATYRLFQSEVDVIEIGIEDIDDVSIHKVSGKEIHEQDKSTVNTGSPLSDRSVALWKTLHIWAELVVKNPTILNNVEFHLVTNGTLSKKCLARSINDTVDEKSSKVVCDELRIMITTLREDLVPYGSTLSKLSNKLLRDMLTKISVFDNMCPKFGGNLEEIQAIRVFDPEIKVSLFDQMGGWVKRKIRELVQTGHQPRIRREDFDKELKGLVRRVSVARLSALVVPFDSNVDISKYESHGFVKQLDWINIDEDSIKEAILDYIHAQDTRIIWTDKNVVSETALTLYERDLKKSWATARRRALRQSLETDELKGQECLDLTVEQDSYIHNEILPKTITCGNFHALAHFTEKQEPAIGWHPQFKSLSKGISE
ncbi:ABC-three component system protein [Terrilactibacillus laevilacticus]|uniref:ABC-three component system protein n=1 Tax=Terrilactibacillus laevilacticus TaxID=1380157 RepID=A0ABW5PNU0_9BACI|nr:ABC-three component system protein [Terrilactibacillus laevilacticus]